MFDFIVFFMLCIYLSIDVMMFMKDDVHPYSYCMPQSGLVKANDARNEHPWQVLLIG